VLAAWWVLPGRSRRAVDPVVVAYARFLKRMDKLGHVKASAEGPKAFAERIEREAPALSPWVRQVTGFYLRLRYGPNGSPLDLAALRKAVGRRRVN
jgi:hypothetical protein